MSFFNALRRFFKPSPEEQAQQLQGKILNMYGQSADRRYYLSKLYALGPEIAPKVLILRFTTQCENGTLDAEEKAMTKDFLLDLGAASVEPLKQFLRTHDKDFNWPYRCLSELLSHEELVDFIVELLDKIGPDWVRNPERKEQLMLTVKGFDEERIALAVLPYLGDDNETIRFLAADAVCHHAHAKGIAALTTRLGQEESQRILTLIAEAFRDKAWTVPEEARSLVSEKLPPQFRLTAQGLLV